METLPKDILLEFNPNTLESVRREFNLDHRRVDEAIDILEEWVKKQNHFKKKDFDREYLERIIITCKGLVERAKTRIDRLCTFKTLMPSYFDNIYAKEEFATIHKYISHANLPKMTPDDYRVYLLRVTSGIEEAFFFTYYKYLFMVSEYMISHDYTKGFILIIDCREVNLVSFVTMLNIVELRHAMTILMEGYGMRLKGLHIITPSKAVTTLVSIMKQVLSEKLGGRIHCHKGMETIYDHVPKEILPEEYGGKLRPLKVINEEWIQMSCSEEYTKYLQEMNDAKTIESYRQTDKFTEQYTGMPGSFRSLTVD